MKLVGGALLLLNAFVWPMWLGIDGWFAFIGVLLVVGGFLKIVLPHCHGCCGCSYEMPAVKKKKR